MTEALLVTAVTVFLIALSAFFVVIEFALLGARRHRLEAEAASSASARAALRGINELTIMLAVAQLGITACTFALGAVTKPAVDGWLGPVFHAIGAPPWLADGAAFGISLVFVTFLHLVVGEMAPKSWAIAHPEFAAKIIAQPARAVAWVFRPLLLWINAMANRLVAASGVTPVERAAVGGQDADTIRQLVEHSASVGTLEESFGLQLSEIIDLARLTVRDLVPDGRELTAVSVDGTVADVQHAAARSGHMRVLIGGDAQVPRVVHVRDTLLEPADAPALRLSRAARTIADDTPAYHALARMRQGGEQLAVITSESRRLGVVTIADILRHVLPPAVRN
ncbi:membrane protein [Pseudoclavibacter endophyticus]|uniref:DUF21 domain-containing protein n=1 Tax=Pseudoclavibacter endophyticus TaxID=1778590 RepID=A0A6H9WLW0_9MICO|nr:CNNM domain-containing protein [Pseudoclavibacter endophyticus]KAB1648791.1 DUF21 domain-containing protein [Pseudoclavibacter endophyticus]GGA68487.1 membrane protein [Pseudoclavibacter endophyticus]